jgi:hypothetical protein
MEYAERYLTYVMTSVQPQLYGNGGPIIMVQVRQVLITCIMPTTLLLDQPSHLFIHIYKICLILPHAHLPSIELCSSTLGNISI